MAIKKAETTRVSIVLENEILKIIDQTATETNTTRSEVIRFLIEWQLRNLKEGFEVLNKKT